MDKAGLSYIVVIPARYESQRLPGKALLDIHGKPLVQHVWDRAVSSGASAVVIATDDERIRQAAEGFGAEVVMTSSDHRSGSDRIAECARKLAWPDEQLIVNLQGDEPLMPAECIGQVAGLLAGDPQFLVFARHFCTCLRFCLFPLLRCAECLAPFLCCPRVCPFSPVGEKVAEGRMRGARREMTVASPA